MTSTIPSKVRVVEQSLFPDIKPDKPVGPILPSVFTGTNADLMLAVAPYYLTGSVLDVTYGEGKWWDRFRPEPFTFHDLLKVDGVDFRALPEADASVDTVCFDPPYVISGTASSERLGPDFQNRYGIGLEKLGHANTGTGTAGFEQMIVDGLNECLRVSRRWVLVKCMEFSQGGHVQPWRSFHDVPHLVTTAALASGCWWKHDTIVHHTGSGPGGHNIFDPKRARRHHSYLLVFAKDARRRSGFDELETPA